MRDHPLGRRSFLGGSASLALAAGAAAPRASQAAEAGAEFEFEVVRTEAEWRARHTPEVYKILREGDTELPHTSPLVTEERAGTYCCQGCGLTIYDSVWKVPLDIGWVFFSHAEPRTVLTSIDGAPPYGSAMGDDGGIPAMIEVHCRRCGSHLGHLVFAKRKLVHCINGAALDFRPAAA